MRVWQGAGSPGDPWIGCQCEGRRRFTGVTAMTSPLRGFRYLARQRRGAGHLLDGMKGDGSGDL